MARVKRTSASAYAISFQQAIDDDCISKDMGYGLIRAGIWVSYLDGRVRKVTLASIQARREQLLAASAGEFKPDPGRARRAAAKAAEAAT